MGKTTKAYRREVFALYSDVVRYTPRDTGTLRRSWLLGRKLSQEAPDARQYSGGELNAAVGAAGEAAGELRLKDDAFIFTNMVYAAPVEAQRHMVARAVADAQARK
tara:strand:+ start:403 stop:720 length:318 start_codon:yes stop_codon:yes gene_type:complete